MKKLFFFLFIALSVLLFAKEQTTYGDLKVSRLLYVYDGDTFKIDIDEYPPIIGKNISIRVAGIDTPELRSKDPEIKIKAYQAKIFTTKFLKNGKTLLLKNIRRGKYFRLVADVIVDGKSLSDELIKNGLALPYDGKKKSKWIINN